MNTLIKLSVPISCVALVAACGGGSSAVSNAVSNAPTLSVGSQVTAASGLDVTVERVYDNGAVVVSFEDGLKGASYRSNPDDVSKDVGSTTTGETIDGTRIDITVEAVSDDKTYNYAGKRYILRLDDSASPEIAAAQTRYDVNGTDVDAAYFGTPVTNMPTGTVTYGAGASDAAFITVDGQTTELPFTFSANLTDGTATLTANNGTHQINGGDIAINATTGEFYGTNAELGATGSLKAANVAGSLFGADAAGVGGILYSTEAAIPSVTANFVGSKNTP